MINNHVFLAEKGDIWRNSTIQIEEDKQKIDVQKSALEKSLKSISIRIQNNCRDAIIQQEHQEKKKFKVDTDILEFSMCEKYLIDDQKFYPYEVGVASYIGGRKKMEDAHLFDRFTIGSFNMETTVFGIFDGHGGKEAADFCKENLCKYIKNAFGHLADKNSLTQEFIFNQLKKIFPAIEKDFFEKFTQDTSGTTATVAMILGDSIWVANVGDSRTLLVKDKETIQVTEDAKPEIPGYRKHLVKYGEEPKQEWIGKEELWRVDGLSMARAIGDRHHIKGNKKFILSKPKITCYSLADFNSCHLVLASDGLYDVASSNEIGEAIQKMNTKKINAQGMSECLVMEALSHHKSVYGYLKGMVVADNTSAIVVKLNAVNS